MVQWFRIHAVSAEDQSSIPNMLVRQLTTKAPGGSNASVLNRHLHTGAHTQNTHTRNLKSKYFLKKGKFRFRLQSCLMYGILTHQC